MNIHNNYNINNKDIINYLEFKKEKELIINLIDKSEINKNILLSNTISRVCGHIYLLYYNNKKYNNIFKIGKSTDLKSRLKNYDNNYIIIYYFYTSNCHIIEKEIISIFKKKFTQCKDIGKEYFIGNCKEMIDIISNKYTNDINNLIQNNNNINQNTYSNNFKCKYCDKIYKYSKTLYKHQRTNCKETPLEKKNHLITIFNKNGHTKNKLELINLTSA
jgi:hypothetical protein